MNSIERKRLKRNWLFLLLIVILFLIVGQFDTPEDRSFGALTPEQQREIIGRQREPVHSLELTAMVRN